MRFKRLEKPLAMPKRDIVKRDSRGPVFHVADLENFDGAVYIHEDHIKEMAESLGMLDKGKAEELYRVVDELRARELKLTERAQELQNGIRQSIDTYLSGVDSAPVVPERAAETPAKPAPKSYRAPKDESGNDGQANDADSKQGSDGVHADSKLELSELDNINL